MSGFREVIKHGGNYLLANLATRALAFITIPVYTRLLTTDEYGSVQVFLGVTGILGSIMALSMDRSISRYYFDQKNTEDFQRFVGTSSVLAGLAFIVNSILLIVFANAFGEMVGLNKKLVYLMIPVSLNNIINLTFQQIYGPQKKSKIIAVSSLAKVYISFALSILLVLILSERQHYGVISGLILGGFIASIYWVRKIKPFFKFSINKAYFKYIFTYSVPLIPYALSGVIIQQFGKIAIGSTQGISEAGFYSLALAIGSLVSIIIGVTHQAWNPYFFEYMNSKNYIQLDKDFLRIFKLTITVALLVATFGGDIGYLLASSDFTQSLYLIPVFTIGFVFYQLAYVYLRNFGYSKNTYYMTITVLVSGISNVLLNLFFIPEFGELGAALSFVIAYVIMAVMSFFINKFLVKLHSPSLKGLAKPIMLSVPFYFLIFQLPVIDSPYFALLLKLILATLFTVIINYNERYNVLNFIKARFGS